MAAAAFMTINVLLPDLLAASTFFFLLTGVKGTGFFKRYIFGAYTVANAFEWVIYGTGVFTNLPVAVYNTYKSYKLRTGKMRPFLEALRPLWALLGVFLASTWWVHRSASLPDRDPRVLMLLIGTAFSNVACRLIVAQMSSQRCDAVNSLLYPLTIAAALSLWAPRYEMAAFYGATATCVVAHVHYGTCVVRQMCDHFRIRCFHIKQRSD